MVKKLFIEGNIHTGKSTFLRKFIMPFLSQCGGFFCQRVLSSEKNITAYRITDLSESDVEIKDTPSLSGIFIRSSHNENINDILTFERAAIELLQNFEKKKLVCLDEIGGIELTSDIFCTKLNEVLASNVPTIGIIKPLENHVEYANLNGSKKEICNKNHMLHDDLKNKYNGKIIPFDENTGNEIAFFLEENGFSKLNLNYVYIIRCSDDTLYTGWTTNINKRIKAHNNGTGAKRTKGRGPVTLEHLEIYPDKSMALKREAAIKKLSRKDKLALCAKYSNGRKSYGIQK